MNQEIDIKEFDKLVEQIKLENPKLDIEFCQYIAGSYLLYDKKGIKQPVSDEDAKASTSAVNVEKPVNIIEVEA